MCQTAKAYNFTVGGIKYNVLSATERTIETVCLSKSDNDVIEVGIPHNLTHKGVRYTIVAIGARAFQNCKQIKSVRVSYGILEIGDEAFRGCSGLTSLNLPSSITHIGKFAFADCVGLTSITLNGSNISMGEKVFDNCKNVNNFTIPDDLQIDGIDFGEDCGNAIRNCIVRKTKNISPQQQLVKDNSRPQKETNPNQNDNRTIANSGLKQYRGNFKMVGFGYDIGRIDGVATYYYTDAYDGTRIFEGDFTFEGVRGDQNKIYYKTIGRFKNNKQVGQWKWVIVDNQGYREEITETTINFDENGVPNGNFETWKGTDKSSKWSWMSCRFENGKISSASFHDGDLLIASGKYNSKGKPIGEWNITGKKVQNKNCHCVYASDGYCTSSYYIDETTGDKINVSSEYPYEVFYKILSRAQKTCFRSTPEIRY